MGTGGGVLFRWCFSILEGLQRALGRRSFCLVLERTVRDILGGRQGKRRRASIAMVEIFLGGCRS